MKKRFEKMGIVIVTNTQDMLSRPETLSLLSDIRSLIEAARRRVSTSANVEMVLLYWHIGNRILKDILGMKRADYGKQIVQTLSGKLILEYGRGYSRTNLFHMIRFAEVFSDLKNVQTLTGQLGWSHFVQIIALDDPLKRDFYAEMCRIERWSTRTLQAKIQGMLYERTALSKKAGGMNILPRNSTFAGNNLIKSPQSSAIPATTYETAPPSRRRKRMTRIGRIFTDYPRASVLNRNPSGRVSAFICVHLWLNRVAREALAG